MLYFIDNRCNFLKAASYLGTFTSHRFKRNVHFSLVCTVKHLIQPFSNSLYAVISILIGESTRMQHDIPNTQRMCTTDFLLQKIYRKLIRTGFV
ncbi:hypothetical protein D3C78_1379320 [compost metagenome]